jgi:hypothetical protein
VTQYILVALLVVAACYGLVWSVHPFLFPPQGLMPSDWTYAQLIQDRYPFHLVSPTWVSDESRWMLAETFARLGFLLATVMCTAAFIRFKWDIGLLVVIAVACLFLHWQHVKVARFDSDFRQRLAGVWLRQETNLQCTRTVAADGSFEELSWLSHPDRTNTYQRMGTWIVTNGLLIETIKSSTNPTERTLHTGSARIIRSDPGGFIVLWQNSVETTWQRVGQASSSQPPGNNGTGTID